MLRHSATRIPPNFEGIVCWLAEFNAVHQKKNENIKYIISSTGNQANIFKKIFFMRKFLGPVIQDVTLLLATQCNISYVSISDRMQRSILTVLLIFVYAAMRMRPAVKKKKKCNKKNHVTITLFYYKKKT